MNYTFASVIAEYRQARARAEQRQGDRLANLAAAEVRSFRDIKAENEKLTSWIDQYKKVEVELGETQSHNDRLGKENRRLQCELDAIRIFPDPEPAELGELLDALEIKAIRCDAIQTALSRGLKGDPVTGLSEQYDEQEKLYRAAREAIVDFVARLTDYITTLRDQRSVCNKLRADLTAENERLETSHKSLVSQNTCLRTELRVAVDKLRLEAPEPSELGKLLDDLCARDFAFRMAIDKAGGMVHLLKGERVVSAQENQKAARQAIVALFARRANTTDPGEKAALMAYSKLANWLNDNHEPVIRETGAGDTYADIAIRLMEKPGDDVAVEHIKEPDEPAGVLACSPEIYEAAKPERKPGDVWCNIYPKAIWPESEACLNMHGRCVLGQDSKTISKCKQCPEFQIQPTSIEDLAPEPKREPGDTWCAAKRRDDPQPDDEACRGKLGNVLPGQKPGGLQMKILKCRQCPEFRTEPSDEAAAAAEAGMRAMGAEELPPLSEEMRKLVWDVVKRCDLDGDWAAPDALRDAIRELEAVKASEDRLGKVLVEHYADEWATMSGDPCSIAHLLLYRKTESIRKLEANQRPPAVTLGTSLQAAILALPATLRADATDMAEVLAAAGQPDLAVRLLVSVKAEVIDPKATCGECKRFFDGPIRDSGKRWCRSWGGETDHQRFACMKFRRKAPETKPAGKARFFCAPDELWVYPPGDDIGWWFGTSSHTLGRSMTSLSESAGAKPHGKVREITEAQAFAELAGWPEGQAKLEELIGGNDDS
jgi:hypothetical protein